MSINILDPRALLADDPTFDEDNDRAQGAPPNQHHRNVIDSLYYVLRDRLAGPTMFMAAELRVYRDLQAVAARQYREPDLLVAVGRPDYERLIYLLSEEGQAPDFVLEVLSDSTKDKDAQEKRRWYRNIGVREYIIADPDGTYAGERRLQRWLLQAGDTQAMTVPPVVGLEGEVIASTVLPYGLVARDGWIRLVEPLTGEELPLLREELAQGRAEAALRREAQTQAREDLERRLTAQARQREAETRQREAEARAAAEAAARLVAEQEITRLRQELQRLRNTDER